MALGCLFIVFSMVIFKYNLRRKKRRVNQKMPSGLLFITTMALSGVGLIYYGYITEPPKPTPKERLMKAMTLDELAGEKDDIIPESNFLKEVSNSAK